MTESRYTIELQQKYKQLPKPTVTDIPRSPMMVGFLPRLHPRHDTNLQVEIGIIHLHDCSQPETLTKATIINVSSGGCCIVVTTPLIGGDHLFYKTLDNDRCFLWLRLREGNVLQARSVWMDGCTINERQVFKIGLQFCEKQKDLSLFLPGNDNN